MDSPLNEVEIKVEYYEDNEIDPLRVGRTKNPIDTNLRPKGSHNESTELNLNNDFNSTKDDIEENYIKTVTWYKSVDDSGRFQCHYCNLTYSTIQTLRNHTNTKHSEEAQTLKESISNSRRKQKFKCHICNELFKLVEDLKQHSELYHKINKTYFCHMCRAVFNDQPTLSEHMLSKHNIIFSKLHTCNICGYRTLKLSHYKQHQNTHTNNRTHKCKQCHYATSYVPNLRIHEQIHNGNKLYNCQFENCNYKTTTRAALRSHKLKHSCLENFLYCDKCTYRTVYKQSLKKHMWSHDRNYFKLNK